MKEGAKAKGKKESSKKKTKQTKNWRGLRGVEWVHGLFLFPLVLGKM